METLEGEGTLKVSGQRRLSLLSPLRFPQPRCGLWLPDPHHPSWLPTLAGPPGSLVGATGRSGTHRPLLSIPGIYSPNPGSALGQAPPRPAASRPAPTRLTPRPHRAPVGGAAPLLLHACQGGLPGDTLTVIFTRSHTHTLSFFHTHSHTHILSHTNTPSHIHTPSHTHTLFHTHILSHTYIVTYTHTPPHIHSL